MLPKWGTLFTYGRADVISTFFLVGLGSIGWPWLVLFGYYFVPNNFKFADFFNVFWIKVRFFFSFWLLNCWLRLLRFFLLRSILFRFILFRLLLFRLILIILFRLLLFIFFRNSFIIFLLLLFTL